LQFKFHHKETMPEKKPSKNQKRREKILLLLAKVSHNDRAPYPDRAVSAAASLLGKNTEEAKEHLEDLLSKN
jgi:hypothetical protein